MGIRLSSQEKKVAVYDSVTDWAIACPVFDSEEEAESFLRFARENGRSDLRMLASADIEMLYSAWYPTCHDEDGDFKLEDVNVEA